MKVYTDMARLKQPENMQPLFDCMGLVKMDDLQKLQERENVLMEKIKTIDSYMEICMQYTKSNCCQGELNAVEEMFLAMSELRNNWHTEWLMNRYDQIITVCRKR